MTQENMRETYSNHGNDPHTAVARAMLRFGVIKGVDRDAIVNCLARCFPDFLKKFTYNETTNPEFKCGTDECDTTVGLSGKGGVDVSANLRKVGINFDRHDDFSRWLLPHIRFLLDNTNHDIDAIDVCLLGFDLKLYNSVFKCGKCNPPGSKKGRSDIELEAMRARIENVVLKNCKCGDCQSKKRT